MNRNFVLLFTLVLVASFVAAPAAQADLVTLTIILATIWTSGVIVNETVLNTEDMSDQEAAQNGLSSAQLAAAQTQSE